MSVETEGLGRIFRVARDKPPVLALQDVTLSIPAGSTHGLLGPNGAGKTTLTRILATLLVPTSGHARVDGADVVSEAERAKARLGLVLGGERGLYSRLTARENVRLWASLNGLSRAAARRRTDESLDRVHLDPTSWDRRTEGFSRGMLQRVHLARALVTAPAVLLLDEPTSGLDPIAAYEFRALVRELRERGTTMLLTTHDLAEAEALCDEVSVLHRGVIVAHGTPAQLRRALGDQLVVEAPSAGPAHADRLAGIAARHDAVLEWDNTTARLTCADERVAGQVVTELVAAGLVQLTSRTPSLEETYRSLLSGDGAYR